MRLLPTRLEEFSAFDRAAVAARPAGTVMSVSLAFRRKKRAYLPGAFPTFGSRGVAVPGVGIAPTQAGVHSPGRYLASQEVLCSQV